MGMTETYIIPVFVGGTLLLTLFVFFIIYYILVQKHKQNKHQLEKQSLLFENQKKIFSARIEEQENTMSKISVELHDSLVPKLSLTQANLGLIENEASTEKRALMIEETDAILYGLLDDVHNISHSLNSNFIKNIGLVEVIKKELEMLGSHKQTVFSFSVTGAYLPMEPERELLIYRIAQELLYNATKHAQASVINLVLTYEPAHFSMSVTDNGIGFDKNIIKEMKGLGFFSMQERVKYLNGTFDIQTASAQGSRFTLSIPYGNTDIN